MVGWYWGLHSWNRILLTAVVATLATTAILGTLTIERASVMPYVATLIWGSGWAAIGAWHRVRALRGPWTLAQRPVVPGA